MGLFLFMMYGGQTEKLRRIYQEKITADMDRICVAAILFYQDHGRFPSAEEGMEVLRVDRTPGEAGSGHPPGGGTLGLVPLDPWRNPYRYQAPEGETPLRLISLGADGNPGGQGDDADVVREGCKSTALDAE